MSGNLMLCRLYLDRGCTNGVHCPAVHVASSDHMWERIEPRPSIHLTYEPGFFVYCYDFDRRYYYKLPSETIFPTVGSENFVVLFNEHGPNFRAKYILCRNLTVDKVCELGANCSDIHCIEQDLSKFCKTDTHHWEEPHVSRYPRLPHGMSVRVYAQNSGDLYDDYPSDKVLLTAGSQQYVEAYQQEGNQIPTRKKMQHCAHFRMNKLCRQGPSCRFIHVPVAGDDVQPSPATDTGLSPQESTAFQQGSASSVPARSPTTTTVNRSPQSSGAPTVSPTRSHNPYSFCLE